MTTVQTSKKNRFGKSVLLLGMVIAFTMEGMAEVETPEFAEKLAKYDASITVIGTKGKQDDGASLEEILGSKDRNKIGAAIGALKSAQLAELKESYADEITDEEWKAAKSNASKAELLLGAIMKVIDAE